jgi:cbb3-type cytochrome oxidase cytochrome c subunit
MNYGPLLFLATFFALATSWFGFVLTPQIQLGRLQPTNAVPTGATYPLGRPGLAREGLQVYRANGCASCHTEQIVQTGTVCDVYLNDAGTNLPALIAALMPMRPGRTPAEVKLLTTGLPKHILRGVSKEEADQATRALNAAGAKASTWIVPIGPDIALASRFHKKGEDISRIERRWGLRRSVAEDYLYDYPVMLGSQRIGPDLANVGVRQPDPRWHLMHLYAPQVQVKGSSMPPYRFLFEKRRIERAPSPDALVLRAELAPGPGYEIVPRVEAEALVAYLTSLRADAPLFVAPVTIAAAVAPTASTNAPAASTNSVPPAPAK